MSKDFLPKLKQRPKYGKIPGDSTVDQMAEEINGNLWLGTIDLLCYGQNTWTKNTLS